jgi:biopolymer transport protein ExbB
MLLQLHVWAFWLLQEQESLSFDPRTVWGNMGLMAKCVVICLFIMSAWSIGVMIDRLIAYNSARKQSRAFAPAVAGALRGET